jgi:transposase
MEAHSQKVRDLVLDAYEQKLPTKQIALRFKVSGSWCRRVKQRLRELNLRGAIEQKHGPDPKLSGADRQRLAGLVKKAPDSTLAELREQLSAPVSVSTIHRALADMKLTLKKSRFTPPSRIGRT